MSFDVATLVREFDEAFKALSGSGREAELEAVEQRLGESSPLRLLLSSQKPLLLEHGASALLHAASARPAHHLVRQTLDRWLEGRGGNAGTPWLRSLSGPEHLTRSEAVATFRAHQTGIGMAVAADGTAWTWGKDGRELFRWNLETGVQLAKARCGFDVATACIGPTGLLAAGSTFDECTIAVWNQTGKRAYRIEDEDDRFYAAVCWLPAEFGEALLVADGRGLKLLELGKKPKTRWTYQKAQTPALQSIDQLFALPDGRNALFLEVTQEEPNQITAHFIGLADGTVGRSVSIPDRLSTYSAGVVAVSPGGTLMACADTSTGVFVWDLAVGSRRQHFASDRQINCVAFESDDILWCGRKDGCILRCELATGAVLALRTDAAVVASVAPWRDFIVALCGDGRVQRFAKSECRWRLDELGEEEQVRYLIPLEGESRLLLADRDKLYEARPGQPRRLLAPLHKGYTKIAATQDGSVVVCAWQLSLREWGLQWLKGGNGDADAVWEGDEILLPFGINQLFTTPDGALLHRVWDAQQPPIVFVPLDGLPARPAQAHFDVDLLRDACVCRDTNQVACAYEGGGGKILLHELDDARPGTHVSLDGSDVIVVGAVGKTLLAISQAGMVGVFSLPEGEQRPSQLRVKSGAPHYSVRRTIVGSVASDRAIVASSHCPALLLQLSDATAIATLGLAVNNGAAFSLDGTRVATIDADGKLSIWNSASGDIVLNQRFSDAAADVTWLGSGELCVKTKSLRLLRLRIEGLR